MATLCRNEYDLKRRDIEKEIERQIE
jgi:hypothetical protein